MALRRLWGGAGSGLEGLASEDGAWRGQDGVIFGSGRGWDQRARRQIQRHGEGWTGMYGGEGSRDLGREAECCCLLGTGDTVGDGAESQSGARAEWGAWLDRRAAFEYDGGSEEAESAVRGRHSRSEMSALGTGAWSRLVRAESDPCVCRREVVWDAAGHQTSLRTSI